MATPSPTGFDVGLLSALNLSLPRKNDKVHHSLAKGRSSTVGSEVGMWGTTPEFLVSTPAAGIYTPTVSADEVPTINGEGASITKATLPPTRFDVGLLSALNMSLPKKNGKLGHTVSKEADAEMASQTFVKSADAAVLHPRPELGAPRGLIPNRFTTQPGPAPSPGFACPNSSKAGVCRKKGASGTDDYIDSYASDTTVGAGSRIRFASEETDPKSEECELNAEAPCCMPMPRFRNSTACKVPSPHDSTGMALPPVLVYADQVQHGGHYWPKQTQEQRLLNQISKQHGFLKQRQQLLTETEQQHNQFLEQRLRRRGALIRS